MRECKCREIGTVERVLKDKEWCEVGVSGWVVTDWIG